MKIGDIVQNKITKAYGTVQYSSFGFSIHSWNHMGWLAKTLGAPAEELAEYWEVVEMPKGYKIHEYGGIVKDEKWYVIN